MKPQIDESKVYTIGTDDGKVIEIKDTNLANGAVIQLWDEWDKPKKWQLWKFEKVGKYDDYRLIVRPVRGAPQAHAAAIGSQHYRET